MTKRRRLILILIAVGVLLGMIVTGLSWKREPEYGGRRLSEWAEKLAATYRRGSGFTVEPQMAMDPNAELIRRVGTNALPWLLDWIGYETPAWKEDFFKRLNPILQRAGFAIRTNTMEVKAHGAMYALIALGPTDEHTITRLAETLGKGKKHLSRIRAALVLRRLGPVGLRPLIVFWNDPRSQSNDLVATRNFMPSLLRPTSSMEEGYVKLLRDADSGIRAYATNALQKMKEWEMNPVYGD